MAAELLQIHVEYLRKLVREGKVPCHRFPGGRELRFLRDKEETGGSLDLFEMTVQPQARMPVAHHHEGWEETIYGLAGVTTWRVDGVDVAVGPGATLFIPRGVVHGFRNDSAGPASVLCILTPGVLGPGYFREMAALVARLNEVFTAFDAHCARCHGADRLGAMGPALFPENLERLRKPDAVKTIAEGRIATQMPGFAATLNADEIARNIEATTTIFVTYREPVTPDHD